MIGQLQTWKTGKETQEEEFRKYEWRSMEWVKEHRKGRAKEGILLAV